MVGRSDYRPGRAAEPHDLVPADESSGSGFFEGGQKRDRRGRSAEVVRLYSIAKLDRAELNAGEDS